jgi:hypothetical protein
VLYVVRRSGRGDVRRVPITGDLVYQDGFNANGIAAIGRRLITVQTNTGKLFALDPATGASKQIALRGKATSLVNGDGLLRKGRTLYVVQNQDNKIAVVQLSRDLSKGTITRYLQDADFDVPTTLARAGGDLWTVNARFGTTPTATTTYDVVRVPRRVGNGADEPVDVGHAGLPGDDELEAEHGLRRRVLEQLAAERAGQEVRWCPAGEAETAPWARRSGHVDPFG